MRRVTGSPWIADVFEWLSKHNRLRPEPIRFVKLDSEHAQSNGKSVNRGLPVLDLARGRDSWCWPKGARPLGTRMLTGHSRSQRPPSFWSAPRIATSGLVQRHSIFEWLCKHNRVRPEPIRFVKVDSESAVSGDENDSGDTETGSQKFALQLRTIRMRKMCKSQQFVTLDTRMQTSDTWKIKVRCILGDPGAVSGDGEKSKTREKKNLGGENIFFTCLRTFTPIATAQQCARYSLVMRVPRHFQARAPSRKLNKI